MTMKLARVLDVRDSGSVGDQARPMTGEQNIAAILSRYPEIAEDERRALHSHADKHGLSQMRRSYVSRGLGARLLAFEQDYRRKSQSTGGWAGLILALILGATLLQAMH